MIGNSVKHLRSYNNTAIADIGENSAPISPVTPRDRRRLRIERRAKRRRLRAKRQRLRAKRRVPTSPHRAPILSHRMTSVRVFHNVLKSVS